MKKLVYKCDHKIKHCFIGGSFGDLTIEGRIYRKEKKFLWYNKVSYTYTINVPYIKDPFYDGEFGTNRILRSYASSMKQRLIDKINEFKENDNTGIKGQKGEVGESNKWIHS